MSYNISLLREQSALSAIVLSLKSRGWGGGGGRQEEDGEDFFYYFFFYKHGSVGIVISKSMLNGPGGSSHLIGLCYIIDSCLWLL